MIQLHNVCTSYGTRSVLNNLSLHIKQGEFVHVLGSNGAGKSTLFNVILRKLLCDRGTVLLDGAPYNRLTAKQIASQIAHVSQNTLSGTIPSFTVLENMEFAALRGKSANIKFRSFNVQSIKDQLVMCELGLEDRLLTKVGNLSGGQRQALSLIMALQQMPKILLLDEHTSALDPNTAKRMMHLTDTMIRRHHITCLMITHNLNDVIHYGDHIMILNNGQIAKRINFDEKSRLTHHHLIDLMLEIEALSC
jgi:putative ABC transport system ATP-binding protein